MKLVIVGGVAGGMSFAARARRLCEDCKIVVFEKGPHVSFANCGLPYYLGGEIADREELLLHSPDSLKESLNLDVRPNSEVQSIDRDAMTVRVAEVHTGRVYDEPYDKLVLSTGAAPFVPPIPGITSSRVHTLRNVIDVDRLNERVSELAQSHQRAVVVGAGFIGLEMVEALHRKGIDVTVLELTEQVLPLLDPEMSTAVQQALVDNGIDVRLGQSLVAVAESDDHLLLTLSEGDVLDAGMVLISVGVRAESRLARDAKLEIDERGGIITSEHLATSDPNIYAVGDAIEVTDAVSGRPSLIPLAGPANRQGRAAANHLLGHAGERTPVLGTAIVRVFDTVAATTGQSEKALRSAGVSHFAIHLHPQQHAGYFPGASPIHLKLLFADDGRILGAQATGAEGVDKRIDVIATAIRAHMTASDLAELELAYAPPFGSAKDAVNMAGFIAENVLSGDLKLWKPDDLEMMPVDAVLLDVRTKAEYDAGHLKGAFNIPHTELRDRLEEIPADVPVYAYCAVGFRSYLASQILRQTGWAQTQSLDGGLQTFMASRPDFALEQTPRQ